MSTLSLKTKSYNKQRAWSDQYNPMLNQVAANIIFNDPKLMNVWFKFPSLGEDRKLGIDMHLAMDSVKLSYRVREAKYLPFFCEGFTIRTTSGFGPSELEKCQQDNYADFLLYAVAHPSEYGEIDAAVLIDLKLLGAQLKAFPHLIEAAEKKNGFIDFKYDDFPSSIVVGMWNVKQKESSCHQ
jgi:hypothetical protein